MWDFIKDNFISLIALVISIVGFFKDNIKDIISVCKNKKINNSAVITISYINEKLIISNKGKSNARNIQIYVDDEDDSGTDRSNLVCCLHQYRYPLSSLL